MTVEGAHFTHPMPEVCTVVLLDLAASMTQDINKQSALTHLNLAWCTIQEITNDSAG